MIKKKLKKPVKNNKKIGVVLYEGSGGGGCSPDYPSNYFCPPANAKC